MIVEAKSDYESNLISNYASGNNSLIYKYISSLSKRDCLPPQMHLGTDTATCDQDKARLINSYFYYVFNDKDLTNDSLTTTNETSGTSLSDIVITAEDVHEALVSLDPNKAMGPDGISPKVVKYCVDALCQPISYLFQLTITNSYLLSEWRTHCVIPIFKCGDRATVSNYRPISLLCIISKVLEKIIFNISIKFLSNSFTPHQFGFLLGRSTLQQLLLFINELLEAKRTNKVSDVIYLDFKKAFDSVTHTKLLHKIRSFGIT